MSKNPSDEHRIYNARVGMHKRGQSQGASLGYVHHHGNLRPSITSMTLSVMAVQVPGLPCSIQPSSFDFDNASTVIDN